MALFSKKQQTTDTAVEAKAPANLASPKATQGKGHALRSFSGAGDLSRVLMNPLITEKATELQSMNNAYVFDVAGGASKPQIAQAVRELYKVSPIRVRVVTIRPKVKRSTRTGRTSVVGGGRKAYVFLKKGDSITLA